MPRMLFRTVLVAAMLAVSACGVQKAPSGDASSAAKPAAGAGSELQSSQMIDGAMINGATPQFLYLASQQALKEGKHELAIELLSALIRKDPQAIDPHFQLLSLLLASGQHKQAAAHLESLQSAAGRAPGQFSAAQRVQLAFAAIRLHLASRETAQALQLLDAFLKTHPVHLQARQMQMRVLAGEQRYDEALTAIAAAIRVRERPESRLMQAQLLLKGGDVAAARVSLKRMQILAPDNEAPALLLSALAVQEKQPARAERLLRDFLADHPDSFRVRLALGKLLIQRKQLFDAIMVYRDLAARSGNNLEVLRQLGMLYFQHGDYAQAEQTFRQLVQIYPDDMGRFYLAASLEAQQKNAEAKALYEQIDAGSALAIEAQIRLAAIEIARERIEQAARRLQRIIRQEPRQLDAHLMLSTIRLTQQRFQQLIDETADLMTMKKLPPQLLFNRAVAFEHFKQYKESEAMLERLLKHAPDHAEALNFLGYTYAVQGIHLNRAKALIRRALIQKPDDGYYLDSLAWAHYRSGDYKQAAATQRKALKQIDDDAIMHEHYGDILWRQGKADAARAAWRRAIELKSEHLQQLQEKIRAGLPEAR
jgi:tetratricopeptide (TPR) repeat protein